jgi:gas vesicle structural protein
VMQRETTPGGDRFMPELGALEESERVSICEVLDRVLNKGVVVAGEVTISVADVDLLYLGLNLVLTSIETARESLEKGRATAGLAIEIGKGKTNGSGHNHAGRI